MKRKRKGSRFGLCYKLAADFIANTQGGGWSLVHGRIQSPLPGTVYGAVDHAWCERGNFVWEPVLDSLMQRQDFNVFYRPTRYARYTTRQTLSLLLEHENYGPWHDRKAERPACTGRSNLNT